MGLRARQVGSADNFAAIIDPVGFAVVAPKGAQVRKYGFVPKEWMVTQVTFEVRSSYDLAAVIDTCSGTSVIKRTHNSKRPTERPNVDHPAVLPQKRVLGRLAQWRNSLSSPQTTIPQPVRVH